MNKEYNLGDRVVFTQEYKRKWDQRKMDKDEYGRLQNWKVWIKKDIPEKEGLIIGKRTLSNGVNHWDSEAGNMYEPKDYFSAYLIAFSMIKKPVLVPIDAIS